MIYIKEPEFVELRHKIIAPTLPLHPDESSVMFPTP